MQRGRRVLRPDADVEVTLRQRVGEHAEQRHPPLEHLHHGVELRDVLEAVLRQQARGAFGQMRMEAIIQDGLPVGAYTFQATLSNGKRPDCVLHMPNTPAGVVIDAVRLCKLGLDRGIGGQLDGPSSYLMKTPPIQYTDDQAHQMVEEFIAGGKKLYEGKGWCAYCHGWEGTGAPSAGRTPPADTDIKMPTNFADAAWQAARSDGELFWVLIHGSHGTDMVPYMPQYITDKEAWQIIAYIRTFGGT